MLKPQVTGQITQIPIPRCKSAQVWAADSQETWPCQVIREEFPAKP